MVILVGTTLNSCGYDKQRNNQQKRINSVGSNIMKLNKDENKFIVLNLINKKCVSNFIFVQSEINEIDTLTIFNFELSKSFYSIDSAVFNIKIDDNLNHLKKIIFPNFTICQNGVKVIGRPAPYASGYIPENCNFFYRIDSTYRIYFANSLEINCIKRPSNIADF